MEEDCYRCGVSGNEVRLYDAIYKDGLIKVCEECAGIMGTPVVRKPTTFQLKSAEKPATVYERLSKAAGLPLKQEVLKEKEEAEKKRDEVKKYDITLKDLIDKKIKVQVEERAKMDSSPRLNLADNFHWVIMRARRSKGMTQEQLAKEIGEAEMTIKMVEQGKLPEDDYRIISKLENFLKIHLLKDEVKNSAILNKEPPKRIGFDAFTMKNLTINDLKEMKDKKEAALNQKRQKEIEKEVLQEDVKAVEDDEELREIVGEDEETEEDEEVGGIKGFFKKMWD